MPNHVTQVVHFEGPPAAISKIKALLREDEDSGALDFQKIIPMPESLNITSGSTTEMGIALLESKAATLGAFMAPMHLNNAPRHFFIDEALKGIKSISKAPDKVTLDHLVSMPMSEFIELGLKANLESIVHGKKAIENRKLYGAKDWYEWSCIHWGTKWSAYSGEILDESPEHLRLRFDTAWSPPTPIYAKLAEMFPEVTFTAQGVDEGWGFAFIIEAANGELEDTEVPCDRSNGMFLEIYQECYGCEPEAEEEDEENEEVSTESESSTTLH